MKFLIFLKKPLFYFNKAWDLCDEIATKLNISKLSLIIDFLYSTIKYNVSIRQYFKLYSGTEYIMLSYKIPNWEQVKTTCIQAAEQLPLVRYIGWDVAITEKGCVLIEGNHDPDYEFLEFVGDRGYKSRIISLLK